MAICAATRVIRCTSGMLYSIVSQAVSASAPAPSSCRTPKETPPMSSRTTIMLTPSAMEGFKGELASRESDAKFAGRMLA